MKNLKINLIFVFIFFCSLTMAQCAFDNTLISTITPTCPGTTNVPCINGGQYIQVNVINGNSYSFSTCGGATWDTQITLYNTAGTISLGYSDDACGLQSTVNWTANYTGILNVLVDQYYCSNNSSCATLVITCTTSGGGGCIGGSNNICTSADPFCTGTSYNYCNTTGTPSMGSYDCLFTTPNPMWMYLNVLSTGSIDIQIQQFNNSGVGIDVDFALYGPYTDVSSGCSSINGSTPTVDCSYSIASTETANIPSAIVGEWYILLITNYADQSGYIQFSQSGGVGSTNCNIVLPIELISFNITKYENYNLLRWETLSETNNSHFEIEKSENIQDWIKIGSIDGSNSANLYEFVDIDNKGSYYYRLKQIDNDGLSNYSNIIFVNASNNKQVIRITNIMGQEVKEDQNVILIYYYSDGTHSKSYILK